VVFLVAVVALHFLAPETDPLRSGISFYALTRFDAVIGAALALVGTAGILVVAASWAGATSTASRVGLLLLAAWGVMSILAGVFPLDPPGADPTPSGTIHNLAGLNFVLVAPAVLLIDSGAPGSRGSRSVTHRPAWLVAAGAVLLFAFNGPLSALDLGGLMQRAYWLALSLWLLLTARRLLRTPAAREVR
jgi:hypothetical protein